MNKRKRAAFKAWETRRKNIIKEKRRQAALKAWHTRKLNALLIACYK